MIFPLDHLIFGNGYGMASPGANATYHWLGGRFYSFIGGLGAQFRSIQWTHPKPGERRQFLGREWVPFNSSRTLCRVDVSWRMVGFPEGLNEANAEIAEMRSDLQHPGMFAP